MIFVDVYLLFYVALRSVYFLLAYIIRYIAQNTIFFIHTTVRIFDYPKLTFPNSHYWKIMAEMGKEVSSKRGHITHGSFLLWTRKFVSLWGSKTVMTFVLMKSLAVRSLSLSLNLRAKPLSVEQSSLLFIFSNLFDLLISLVPYFHLYFLL